MAQSLNPGPNAAPGAKRLLITLMGGAGLILLGGGGALLGLNSHLTSLQTTAQQKEQEVGSSEQIAKRYESTQEAYTQTQNRIQFLEASVSAKSYVPTLLGQLQTLAAKTHLTVTAVRPAAPPPPAPMPVRSTGGEGAAAGSDLKKPPPPPPYDTLNIDVDVTGTYTDTATFLYSLTRFPKILSVTGAQLHPNSLPSGTNPYASPLVTTNLKMVAFMFHDDTAAVTPASVSTATSVANSVTPSPVSGLDRKGIVRNGIVQGTIIPPASVGTISGAAGRAAAGAVGATKAANERGAVGVGTL